MSRYRKRPVVIEANQVNFANRDYLARWCGGRRVAGHIVISTPEGEMAAMPGDWIIRGVAGEFYPCKPAIFEATYEQEDTP